MKLLLLCFYQIVHGSKELLLWRITDRHEQGVMQMWVLSLVSLTLLGCSLVHCLSWLSFVLIIDAVLPTAHGAWRLNLFLFIGCQKHYILVNVPLSFSWVCAVYRWEYTSGALIFGGFRILPDHRPSFGVFECLVESRSLINLEAEWIWKLWPRLLWLLLAGEYLIAKIRDFNSFVVRLFVRGSLNSFVLHFNLIPNVYINSNKYTRGFGVLGFWGCCCCCCCCCC